MGDRLSHAVAPPPQRPGPERRVCGARANGRGDGVRAAQPDRARRMNAPDRPDAAELVEAVFEFLAEEVLPNAPDHRTKFRTLVAMNALGIARRELGSTEQFPPEEDLRELARRIRA